MHPAIRVGYPSNMRWLLVVATLWLPLSSVAAEAPPEVPVFHGEIRPIDDALADRMRGVSWHEGCPVGLQELAVLDLSRWTPRGEVGTGQLIVHRDVAEAVRSAFATLFEARFPITRMEPVHLFDGSDAASMAADNTSGFNCRPIAGSKTWSEHAWGRAVDLNPLRNPYVRGDRVQPEAGRAWLDRDPARPGVIVPGGPVVDAFRAIGWGWGGSWPRSKDYQHFSATGR